MPTDISGMDMKWYVLRLLTPYLREFRGRIVIAFGCLAIAKIATISLPLFLKYIVDNLDAQTDDATAQASNLGDALGAAVQNLPYIVGALILGYGAARFAAGCCRG